MKTRNINKKMKNNERNKKALNRADFFQAARQDRDKGIAKSKSKA